MLGDCGFFLAGQVADVEQLIGATYDLAKYWGVDPQAKMGQPVSIIAEEFDHALRIVNEQSQSTG